MAREKKSVAERRHAKRRFYERFGERLKDSDLHEVVQAIQNGKVKLVDRQSNIKTRWELLVKGHLVWGVYNSKTKEIVTFLRPGEEESVLDLLVR